MKHGRIDANHTKIVDSLRRCGCSVTSLADLGNGCPDLLVGFRGENFLFEVKSDTGKTNRLQNDWISRWNGQVAVIYSFDDAAAILGLYVVNEHKPVIGRESITGGNY